VLFIFTTAKQSSWTHSLPWKCFHVPRGNFHCMEGVQKSCIYGNNHFNTNCSFHILCCHCLLMILMDPWNHFQWNMEILPIGQWNDFHGYWELFPWVHGNVSVGIGYHFNVLNICRISSFHGSFLD
jgi:hypothetical protein